MSNVLYDDKMYNEKVKKEFMLNYGEGTRKILERIFKISCPAEEDLGKDLFDFSREELRRLFYLFSATTEYSSKVNISWVRNYIDWAIEQGYTRGPNPLDGVSNEWKQQFVVKAAKRFWTEDEINQIISKLVNAQDAVIVALLFNGVRGENNSEITKLKKSDIDAENCMLTLTNKNGEKRKIKVSEQCIALCEKASRERVYDKRNGNPSQDVKSETVDLIDNEYVVRSAKTRLIHTGEADGNIVYRRLAAIDRELDGLGLFNPTNIMNSGMLAMAKKLYEKNGKLGKEEYEEIFNQFNEKSPQTQKRIKDEFLNIETLKTVYKMP